MMWCREERHFSGSYALLVHESIVKDRSICLNVDRYFVGGLSIAVPGAIRGFHEAWQRYGQLPWSSLFQPAIDQAEKGIEVAGSLANYIQMSGPKFPNGSEIRYFHPHILSETVCL